jgi:signal transduction histidine kinase
VTGRVEASAPEVLLQAAEPEVRVERFVNQLAYLLAGLPLGAAYLALIAGGIAAAVLGTVAVGLPLLLVVSGVAWRGAEVERRMANRLLDAQISPLPPLPGARGGSLWRRVRARHRGRAFWKVAAFLALKLPLTILAAATAGLGLFATGALVVLGVRGLTGGASGYVGPFALGPALGLGLCLLALPTGILTIALTDVIGTGLRAVARSLLASRLPAGAPVRETLARSLGDRTLSIAYWLPDRGEFVDERGARVPLPEPGSGRAWTAVELDGRRVAAIIHDAILETTPELVEATAAAASLALDNERLKAELRARVEELRASRVRIVEASSVARRKVERDLHDGAQQQLVAMAVELRLLRGRVSGNAAAIDLLDRIESKLSTALEELRDLAQGLHPGILTDRGLAPALESLAARTPLDVECDIDLPTRPPASVEAVAYFVVNEALTNVLKYARASRAVIRARYEGRELVIELRDDGVGGVDETRGTGIQGLRDRVGALDGIIDVDSRTGHGTSVRARIPVTRFG